MKKKFLYFYLLCFIASSQFLSADFLFDEPEANIVINNRILAKVNGKVISVIDLMKKMDLLFYRQYPEYTSSIDARFQFYQTNWKYVLQELVDKELIVADAEECKLIVNQGDVRKELESLFGPNIVTNLDKVGLTFDEAMKMLFADITLRRMLYFRVHAKALGQVTPQVVRQKYEQYAKENMREPEWHYRVISIRGRNPSKSTELGNLAYQLLTEEKVPLTTLPGVLKEKCTAIIQAPNITISEEYHHTAKDLSDKFKEILIDLQPGNYSPPMSQKSRADNTTVVRIFYLNSTTPGGTIPFKEVENQLRDELMGAAVEKEMALYLNRLRKHFDVQEKQLKDMVEEDFEPFALKKAAL